jgi:hypothetical protein
MESTGYGSILLSATPLVDPLVRFVVTNLNYFLLGWLGLRFEVPTLLFCLLTLLLQKKRNQS